MADSNNAGAIRLCWQYFGEGHRRRRATFKSLPITRRRRNQTGCGYGLFPGDVLPCVYSAIGDLTSAIPRRSVGHRRACARPWSRLSRWRSGLGCGRGPSVREAGVRTDSGSSHRRAHRAFRCTAPARRGAFADGAYPSIARLPVFHKICFTMLVAWAKASDGLPLQ